MMEVSNQTNNKFTMIDRSIFKNIRPMFLVSNKPQSASPQKYRAQKGVEIVRFRMPNHSLESTESPIKTRDDSLGLENKSVREEIYNSFGIVERIENKAR